MSCPGSCRVPVPGTCCARTASGHKRRCGPPASAQFSARSSPVGIPIRNLTSVVLAGDHESAPAAALHWRCCLAEGQAQASGVLREGRPTPPPSRGDALGVGASRALRFVRGQISRRASLLRLCSASRGAASARRCPARSRKLRVLGSRARLAHTRPAGRRRGGAAHVAAALARATARTATSTAGPTTASA
jgi:hypothetical protein